MLEKILEKRRIQNLSGKPTVFVFGDSQLDLTMLRPDLETKGLGSISDEAIANRDARFQETGVMPHSLQGVSWWELSVIPERSILGSKGLCGPIIEEALKHPKITKSTGWGITSILQTVVDHLKARFSEPDDGIPIPEGNFD